MALSDDINALPTTVADGNTGHTVHHQTIHAALKNHNGRFPTVDTTFGTRVIINGQTVYGDTGWYDVTSMLTPAPTEGALRVRRIAGWLLIDFNYLRYSAGVSASLTLPVGWRSVLNDGGTLLSSAGSAVGRARLVFGGTLTIIYDNSGLVSHTLRFPAQPTAPWPTAAPTA